MGLTVNERCTSPHGGIQLHVVSVVFVEGYVKHVVNYPAAHSVRWD